MYVHTYVHTYIHTYIHYIHTIPSNPIPTQPIPSHTPPDQTRRDQTRPTYIHTYRQTYAYAYACADENTCTEHAYIHRNTHTHTFISQRHVFHTPHDTTPTTYGGVLCTLPGTTCIDEVIEKNISSLSQRGIKSQTALLHLPLRISWCPTPGSARPVEEPKCKFSCTLRADMV